MGMLLRRRHLLDKKKKDKAEEDDLLLDNQADLSDELELSDMTVADLKELAKAEDVEGYSTMKKEELIQALGGD